MFAEERAAAEASRRAAESERRAAADAEAERAAREAVPAEDFELLLLAEEDGRRTLFAIAAMELEANILRPFVSVCEKAASVLTFEASPLGANGLLAAIAGLRCCPRLRVLSFAKSALDSPMAVLLFCGPLRQGLLPCLETLVLDDNPIGSVALNVLLRLLRSSTTISPIVSMGNAEGGVKKERSARSQPLPLSRLSTVSLLGVSCDAAIVRKMGLILDPRLAAQRSARDLSRRLAALEYSSEAPMRRGIADEEALGWHALASRFFIDQKRHSGSVVGGVGIGSPSCGAASEDVPSSHERHAEQQVIAA